MSNVLFVHFPSHLWCFIEANTLELTLEGRSQRVDKTHNKKHTFGALIHLAQSPQRLKNCTEPAFHYDFMNSIGELINSIAEFNSETDRWSLAFLVSSHQQHQLASSS